MEWNSKYILYLSKDKSIYLEGNYDTLKEYLSKVSSLNTISINELNNKIIKTKEVKPKLSNNKINEIQESIDYIHWKQNFYNDVLSGKTKYYSNLINNKMIPDIDIILFF